MASSRPRLQTGALPVLDEDSASTASPARGRETRDHLLSKLRSPPLVHAWDFWHEKPVPTARSPAAPTQTPSTEYASQLTHLHPVTDVRSFWSLYNNIAFATLPQRQSIHLFHAHVKPIWEDPRNSRGGCWTFRVPKAQLTAVFQAVALLAIGEQLQEAVFESDRSSFKDDICGISFRQRSNGGLVLVWNRDAGHTAGIKRVRECVDTALKELGIRLPEGAAFYKAHSAHDGFNASPLSAKVSSVTATPSNSAVDASATHITVVDAEDKHAITAASVEAMEREVEKVKRILEEVQLSSERMEEKLAVAAAREEEKDETH